MKFITALTLLLLVAGAAQAATVETKAGTKDLLFQFGGLANMQVTGFNVPGGPGRLDNGFLNTPTEGIGARYYFADDWAVRPALRFTYDNETHKDVTPNYSDKVTGFGLGVGLEKHLQTNSSVSPYVGVQVAFDLDKESSDQSGTTAYHKITAFGGALMAGFEWAFAQDVTLGAEYQLGVVAGSSKTDQADVASETVLGIGSASLFLSVGW